MAKELIAYFSRRGGHYINGSIKSLPVGHTEVVASLLEKITGADLFKIDPVEEYSADYCVCIDQARQDLQRGIRPELKSWPDSLESYDVIYLGYPNYWGTMPAAVFSFLERFDFTGKVIKPFCIHDGDGLGNSERDLRQVCPTAVIKSGLPICSCYVNLAFTDLEVWIEQPQ